MNEYKISYISVKLNSQVERINNCIMNSETLKINADVYNYIDGGIEFIKNKETVLILNDIYKFNDVYLFELYMNDKLVINNLCKSCGRNCKIIE